ncbi:ubiquitin-activating enzyme [Plasmodium sp. DRC-Itaito]|nr:ubiquitin-activating enzyme [Plasmodium sp. DRC-Itaito]
MNILCIHIYSFIACLLLCHINQVFTLKVLNYNNVNFHKNNSFSIPLYNNLFPQEKKKKKKRNVLLHIYKPRGGVFNERSNNSDAHVKLNKINKNITRRIANIQNVLRKEEKKERHIINDKKESNNEESINKREKNIIKKENVDNFLYEGDDKEEDVFNSNVNILENEKKYSRQIYTHGYNEEKKIRGSKILIIGLDGISCEICKNLSLCGVREIGIYDNNLLTYEDIDNLYLCNKKLVNEQIKSISCVDNIQILNDSCKIKAITTNLYDDMLNYDIVVSVNQKKNFNIKLNNYCRKNKKKFICVNTCGLFGRAFIDYGDFSYTNNIDTNTTYDNIHNNNDNNNNSDVYQINKVEFLNNNVIVLSYLPFYNIQLNEGDNVILHLNNNAGKNFQLNNFIIDRICRKNHKIYLSISINKFNNSIFKIFNHFFLPSFFTNWLFPFFFNSFLYTFTLNLLSYVFKFNKKKFLYNYYSHFYYVKNFVQENKLNYSIRLIKLPEQFRLKYLSLEEYMEKQKKKKKKYGYILYRYIIKNKLKLIKEKMRFLIIYIYRKLYGIREKKYEYKDMDDLKDDLKDELKDEEICFMIYDEIMKDKKNKELSDDDIKKFTYLCKKEKKDISNEIINQFCSCAHIELSPFSFFWGALLSQQILKGITHKFKPIHQMFYYDRRDLFPFSNISKMYYGKHMHEKNFFGKEYHDFLKKLNILLIGSGALGCEFLKLLAISGVSSNMDNKKENQIYNHNNNNNKKSENFKNIKNDNKLYNTSNLLYTNKNNINTSVPMNIIPENNHAVLQNKKNNIPGCVQVVDYDYIEESNLSRQFLFRTKDINKLKCEIACENIKMINEDINCDFLKMKVDETIFDNKDLLLKGYSIFRNKNNKIDQKEEEEQKKKKKNLLYIQENPLICILCLDNLKSRILMDKFCLLNSIPLIESGIEGLKASSQIVYPFCSETYSSDSNNTSSSNLYDDEKSNSCTITSFPRNHKHIIEFAKSVYNNMFYENVIKMNTFINDPLYYLGELCKYENISDTNNLLHFFKLTKLFFHNNLHSNIEILWNNIFVENILNLLKNSKEEEIVQYFDSLNKLPEPIYFNHNNKYHINFFKYAMKNYKKVFKKIMKIKKEMIQDIFYYKKEDILNLIEKSDPSISFENIITTLIEKNNIHMDVRKIFYFLDVIKKNANMQVYELLKKELLELFNNPVFLLSLKYVHNKKLARNIMNDNTRSDITLNSKSDMDLGEPITKMDVNIINRDELMQMNNPPKKNIINNNIIKNNSNNNINNNKSNDVDVDLFCPLIYNLQNNKDDINFIYSVSNIRCENYHFKKLNIFDFLRISNNIIPSIVTIVSMISSLAFLEMYKVVFFLLNKNKKLKDDISTSYKQKCNNDEESLSKGLFTKKNDHKNELKKIDSHDTLNDNINSHTNSSSNNMMNVEVLPYKGLNIYIYNNQIIVRKNDKKNLFYFFNVNYEELKEKLKVMYNQYVNLENDFITLSELKGVDTWTYDNPIFVKKNIFFSIWNYLYIDILCKNKKLATQTCKPGCSMKNSIHLLDNNNNNNNNNNFNYIYYYNYNFYDILSEEKQNNMKIYVNKTNEHIDYILNLFKNYQINKTSNKEESYNVLVSMLNKICDEYIDVIINNIDSLSSHLNNKNINIKENIKTFDDTLQFMSHMRRILCDIKDKIKRINTNNINVNVKNIESNKNNSDNIKKCNNKDQREPYISNILFMLDNIKKEIENVKKNILVYIDKNNLDVNTYTNNITLKELVESIEILFNVNIETVCAHDKIIYSKFAIPSFKLYNNKYLYDILFDLFKKDKKCEGEEFPRTFILSIFANDKLTNEEVALPDVQVNIHYHADD